MNMTRADATKTKVVSPVSKSASPSLVPLLRSFTGSGVSNVFRRSFPVVTVTPTTVRPPRTPLPVPMTRAPSTPYPTTQSVGLYGLLARSRPPTRSTPYLATQSVGSYGVLA